jgi:hypothetical protein
MSFSWGTPKWCLPRQQEWCIWKGYLLDFCWNDASTAPAYNCTHSFLTRAPLIPLLMSSCKVIYFLQQKLLPVILFVLVFSFLYWVGGGRYNDDKQENTNFIMFVVFHITFHSWMWDRIKSVGLCRYFLTQEMTRYHTSVRNCLHNEKSAWKATRSSITT